jgi:hypothetical protein
MDDRLAADDGRRTMDDRGSPGAIPTTTVHRLSSIVLWTDRLLFGALFITALALLAFSLLARLETAVRAWRPASER